MTRGIRKVNAPLSNNCHPLIRVMVRLAEKDGRPIRALSRIANVSSAFFYNCQKNGNKASLAACDKFLRSMGYRLTIEKCEKVERKVEW